MNLLALPNELFLNHLIPQFDLQNPDELRDLLALATTCKRLWDIFCTKTLQRKESKSETEKNIQDILVSEKLYGLLNRLNFGKNQPILSKAIMEHPSNIEFIKPISSSILGHILSADKYSIRMWNVNTQSLIGEVSYKEHGNQILDADMAMDDCLVISFAKMTPPTQIGVCNHKTGKSWLEQIKGAVVCHQKMTHDRKKVVFGLSDGSIGVLNIESQTPFHRLSLENQHKELVTCVECTHDGKFAISTSYDQTIKIWNLETEICETTLEGHADKIQQLHVTPNGKHLVSVSNNLLKISELKTRESYVLEEVGKGIRSVCLTPDNQHVIIGAEDHTIQIWNLETRVLKNTLKGCAGKILSLRTVYNGRYLVSGSTLNPHSSEIRIWNLETGLVLHTIPTSGHTYSIDISLDRRYLYVNHRSLTISMWDCRDFNPILADAPFKILDVIEAPTSEKLKWIQERFL